MDLNGPQTKNGSSSKQFNSVGICLWLRHKSKKKKNNNNDHHHNNNNNNNTSNNNKQTNNNNENKNKKKDKMIHNTLICYIFKKNIEHELQKTATAGGSATT